MSLTRMSGRTVVSEFERFRCGASHDDLCTMRLEEPTNQISRVLLVLDDQDLDVFEATRRRPWRRLAMFLRLEAGPWQIAEIETAAPR